jgi:hypothetical protein
MATELHVSVSLLRQLYSQPVIHNRKESSPRRNDDAPNKADPPPYDRIPMKDILRAQEAQEDKMMEQDSSIIQAMESRICPAWPVIVDTLARLCDYHHQSFETFINSVDCVLHSACNQVRNRQNQSGSSRGTIYITTPELLACVVASSKVRWLCTSHVASTRRPFTYPTPSTDTCTLVSTLEARRRCYTFNRSYCGLASAHPSAVSSADCRFTVPGPSRP